MKKNKNIVICIANNYSMLERTFVMSLLQMQYSFMNWIRIKKKPYTLSIILKGGYNLDMMRNDICKDALEQKADYLLLLDTDMNFPSNTIVRMIEVFEANKWCEIVSGLYVTKKEPYMPLIFQEFRESDGVFMRAVSFPLNRPFHIVGAGAGVLMVKRQVFDRIEQPYFKWLVKDEIKEVPKGLGEDLYFFWKAKPKALCDPTIICGHFDTRPLTIYNYIRKNNIKVKDNIIRPTRKQILDIQDKYYNSRQFSRDKKTPISTLPLETQR